MNAFAPLPRQPENPFSQAVSKLQESGRTISPSDIPGLVLVDGQELTMGQVIDLAKQVA